MDRRRPNERIRSFFKVFFPETCTNSLKIPSAFSSFMQGQLPKRTILRDRNGKTWSVKVEKVENNFFFVDGWPEFVEDNSMQLGEFLVFQFDGHSVYDVKLFGYSNCEKNIEEDTTKVKEEGGEKEDKEEEGEEEEEETNEEEEEAEEEEEEEEEGESYSNATENCVDAEYIPEEDDTDEEQEQEVEDEKTAKFHKRVVVGDSKSSQRGLIKSSGGKQGNEKAKAFKVVSESKRPAVDPYGYDIFKSGSVMQPKNPYFVTKIRAKRKDVLYVPVDCIRDYNLSLPSAIVLRDPFGRKWTSKLNTWKDGRLWYYGGWRSLCRINIIGMSDSCICEFVKGEGGDFFIQVHIVPIKDDAQN